MRHSPHFSNGPRRNSGDEDLRLLERAWQDAPSDTQASRRFFLALLRRDLLPAPDAQSPGDVDEVRGHKEHVDQFFDYLARLERPEVVALAARIDDLGEYDTAEGDLISEEQHRRFGGNLDVLNRLIGLPVRHEAVVLSTADREPSLFARHYRNVVNLLRKRLTDGTYRRDLAPKAFVSLVEMVVRYVAAVNRVTWNVAFPPRLRRFIEGWIARRFEARWATSVYKDWPRSKSGGLKRHELDKKTAKNPDEDRRSRARSARAAQDPTTQARVLVDRLRSEDGSEDLGWLIRAAATLEHPGAQAAAAMTGLRPFTSASREMQWTRADYGRAQREGWDIFESDNRGLEIEKLDDPVEEGARSFEGDSDVQEWLLERARHGDRHAIKAILVILLAENYKEFAQIVYSPSQHPRDWDSWLGDRQDRWGAYFYDELPKGTYDSIAIRAKQAGVELADAFLGL